MKQLTIRADDEELVRGLEELSRERRWSLNQTATHLLRKGLGLPEESPPQPIGDQLDAFFGRWSMTEAQEFERHVEDAFGNIDEENWK
jgi:hypothetical protein